ncbi:MAG: 3-hydroxyacyl-CoA dehydrogenase [Promethearchaeota archaeon]|nr:MAG: 3-hydroxyacyl-CoA dehydrogenase [Candidatus Lokiarchaeota archaeon]
MLDIDDIRNISVVGAGIMGQGIAQVSLMAGYKITIIDLNEKIVTNGVQTIEEGLKHIKSKGKLEEDLSISDLMENCSKSTDLESAVKNADFVFEAVVEKMEVKKEVCKIVMENSPSHCILASNTSTFKISEIAKDVKRAEHVIGMHFFPPVANQCCVEVMKGEQTSDEVLDMCVILGEKLPCIKGKRLSVRIEKESPGFIANRLLIPNTIYTSWIFDQAFENNIPWEQIDADAGVGQFVPMGPCQMTDYLGIDVTYNSMKSYERIISPDFAPGKVLTKFIKEGNLGKKTGNGFYDWSNGTPNLNINKKAGLFNPEIHLAIQLNEGCKLLEEGIVSGYKIIDEVMAKGTSMPGPFSAGKRNYQNWSKLLEELAEVTGKHYLKPCDLMKSGKFIEMRK